MKMKKKKQVTDENMMLWKLFDKNINDRRGRNPKAVCEFVHVCVCLKYKKQQTPNSNLHCCFILMCFVCK